MLSKPSSTITAATLAGMGVAIAWQILATFMEVTLEPGLVAGSATFVSALVGYFTVEKVLPLK